MKKNVIISFFCVAFISWQCTEEEGLSDQVPTSSPTSMVSKIETILEEGESKEEGFLNEEKIETFLPENQVNGIKAETLSKIESLLNNRKYQYSIGRQDFGGYDVGVLPFNGTCPSQFEKIVIYMDCEDNNPITSLTRGSQTLGTAPSNPIANGNITLTFCRVDGRLFVPFANYSNSPSGYNPYAVLKLGPLRLPNSRLLVRHFDNEDRRNANSYSGDISPNIVNSNTTLNFHVIEGVFSSPNPGGASFRGLPILPFDYGVLGDAYLTSSGWSSTPYLWNVAIDDEDSGNSNWATFDGANYSNGLSFLTATGNTYLKLIFP